jgi:hypothetical protein
MDEEILELKKKWETLKKELISQYGEEPGLQEILFLIGVQELGKGYQKFTKDQKMDLIHIATCRLLSTFDYYELEGTDADGWPHWKEKEKIPYLTIQQQERLLRQAIIEYFEESGLI